MSKLYLVGTPIGNLEDMTLRAIKTLQEVSLIASEDTRHTGKLLQHFAINTPQISYHDHNRQFRLPTLLNHLQNGQDLALVTDAGMPGICDPGQDLVRACWQAGIEVVPIPGVTALITALVASGLSTTNFIFEGFLPSKGKEQTERFHQWQLETRTIIFYEAPHRLVDTLLALAAIVDNERRLVTGRELTKLHETFWSGTLAEAILYYQSQTPKGEFVVLLEGKTEKAIVPTPEILKKELQQLLEQGLSRSQASRQLAELTQLPRRHLYQLSLEL